MKKSKHKRVSGENKLSRIAKVKSRSLRILKNAREELVINNDFIDDPRKMVPVLTYVVGLGARSRHDHITLTVAQARRLYLWLGRFLGSGALPKGDIGLLEIEAAVCLRKSETGLPLTIWCPADIGFVASPVPHVLIARNRENDFRIRDTVPVSITSNPAFLSGTRAEPRRGQLSPQVRNFIRENMKILLEHWNGILSDCELLSKLSGRELSK